MFQLFVKISLFFCLFVCTSAVSITTGARKDFAGRPPSRPSLPPAQPLLKPSLKDYENLYTAIATEFAPSRDMAKYLRLSLYAVAETSGACPRGYDYLRFAEVEGLHKFVTTKFNLLNFSNRDYVSLAGLAGIVAVEKAFSCIKIKRSFALIIQPINSNCTQIASLEPISNLIPVWPFLGSNDISRTEMATLYKVVKLLEQSGETEKVEESLISKNDTSFIKDFADVYAKVLLIGTNTTSRVVLSEGSSTC